MNIHETAEECYRIAKTKGWGDPPIVEQVALLHSECSEILEAFRNNEPLSWTDDDNKPHGVASEFADLFIRLGHYAISNGINLEFEIRRKLDYNMTRPYRHGGKAV